jgi:hypothetical protein
MQPDSKQPASKSSRGIHDGGKATPKACWTCVFQQIGGPAFLGMCTYFSAKLEQPNKPIPSYQVDKGCKYWEAKLAVIKPKYSGS